MTYVAVQPDIRMVSISELLRNLKFSADDYYLCSVSGWFEMLEEKLSHRQVPPIIRAIEEFGFLDPICVTKDDSGWELGNGHHRLSVAIMLGLDQIPVDFSDWHSDSSSAHHNDLKRKRYDLKLADWIASFWTNAEEGQLDKQG